MSFEAQRKKTRWEKKKRREATNVSLAHLEPRRHSLLPLDDQARSLLAPPDAVNLPHRLEDIPFGQRSSNSGSLEGPDLVRAEGRREEETVDGRGEGSRVGEGGGGVGARRRGRSGGGCWSGSCRSWSGCGRRSRGGRGRSGVGRSRVVVGS